MNLRTLRTVQGCPVYADIAPYIAILVNDTRSTVNSIYRGDPAAKILHKHGKHTQREIYYEWTHGLEPNPANPPGQSTHELYSDGHAYPNVPPRVRLQWWQQGFDVNDSDVEKIIEAGKRYGWKLFRPYSAGTEYHHLNFKEEPKRPKVGSKLWRRVWRLRLTLPRS